MHSDFICNDIYYLQHRNNTDDYEYSQNISDHPNAPRVRPK